jgi:hypothetical protein
MYVRMLYVLVIAAAVLMGTVGQQLLALAVAGVLVTRRAAIMHAHHGAPDEHREPVLR